MSETNSVYIAFNGNSYLFGGNAPYVEEMYENYLNNPSGVFPTNGAVILTRYKMSPPLMVQTTATCPTCPLSMRLQRWRSREQRRSFKAIRTLKWVESGLLSSS